MNGVYEISSQDPFASDFGLRDQLCRAAISVMANIAEGFVSQGNKSFVRYLFVALASAAEVQSHLYVALDRNYIKRTGFDKCFEQSAKTSRLINGLLNYLLHSRKDGVAEPEVFYGAPAKAPDFPGNGALKASRRGKAPVSSSLGTGKLSNRVTE